MAFASWWYKTHVYEKNSGTPSKAGEKKKSETTEGKRASHSSNDPSRITANRTTSSTPPWCRPSPPHTWTIAIICWLICLPQVSPSPQTSLHSATMASTSFPDSTSTLSMNPMVTKATPIKQTKGLHYHDKKRKNPQQAEQIQTEEKSQTTKATEPHMKDAHKEKAKDDKMQKSPGEQLAAESKDSLFGKDTLNPSDQPTQDKPIQDKPTEGPQNKENESVSPPGPVKVESSKPSEKRSLDDALDDLVDTLGGLEEKKPESPKYTGPPVSDPVSSTYIEELGKREGSIPPEYRKLLESHEGASRDPPKAEKSMGEDEAIDSLSSDFTCSSAAPEKAEDKEKASGEEVLEAQSVDLIKSALPPDEKKRRIEETASDKAVDDLCETLSYAEAEPEIDTSSLKEVDEVKSKEERLKKCGEREDTLPADYHLKPAMDKDGKPLLPKPEEKPKPMSESKLVDELSKDFESPKPQGKQPKPSDKAKKSETPVHAPVKEVVSKTRMCVVQEVPQKPAPKSEQVPDDAVEALASSLPKKEIDPEEKKPAVDKVKEKFKEEKSEKVGEEEETIPPEYRLKAAKCEENKLLEKKQREKVSPMSESDILDALSESFSSSKAPVTHAAVSAAHKSKKKKCFTEVGVMTDPIPPPTKCSTSPPDASQKDKGLDDAYDELSQSLEPRKPDPEEKKPVEDKVKEKTKIEHRDKLGERDDTIPPEYSHLLDNDNQDNPEKPPPKEPKNSADDKDPIDTLSEGFDKYSQKPSPEGPQKLAKKKDEKDVSSKSAKNGGKSKTKEKSSRSKADGEKTS
ncbi:calpastatin [Antechinus flavipes]|uniref:calpastatin n=1 Tax=Antechinus flavipes TaxID=38775 RepID=UPI002235A9BD|nr:calpastatin [Antechinus flavipes]